MARGRPADRCRRSRPSTTGPPAASTTPIGSAASSRPATPGINWPTEYGGRGATLIEQLIYLEETTRAGAPYVGVNFVGTLHAGPTIMTEASAEQKAEHLPRILRGDEVWCQGFCEPDAGSDLASLSCQGVRDGDEYVITGQKTWTLVRPGRRLVRAAHPHRPRRARSTRASPG